MPRNKQEIEKKFNDLDKEAQALLAEADSNITEVIDSPIIFNYETSAPTDVFTRYEKAQSLCFVTKYDALPEPETVDIREHNGRFYPNNINHFRYLLNEYRSIIQNRDDSTHYLKIHFLCRQKLANEDPSVGLSISVKLENNENITKKFIKLLDQKNKAVTMLIKKCEFDYIYNGILQHSDQEHTNRYIKDYNSGELHYIFIKHAWICDYIKKELSCHHYLLKQLSGIIMGSL